MNVIIRMSYSMDKARWLKLSNEERSAVLLYISVQLDDEAKTLQSTKAMRNSD